MAESLNFHNFVGMTGLMMKPELLRDVYRLWERCAKPITCNASGASSTMVDNIVDILNINLVFNVVPCCMSPDRADEPAHIEEYV